MYIGQGLRRLEALALRKMFARCCLLKPLSNKLLFLITSHHFLLISYFLKWRQ
jgi:BarA-like signal transduction histidine kinase